MWNDGKNAATANTMDTNLPPPRDCSPVPKHDKAVGDPDPADAPNHPTFRFKMTGTDRQRQLAEQAECQKG